jgi:hypothetical protein
MRNWIVPIIVILLFICATLVSADKFGGPKLRQPPPPPDTTQVDSIETEPQG